MLILVINEFSHAILSLFGLGIRVVRQYRDLFSDTRVWAVYALHFVNVSGISIAHVCGVKILLVSTFYCSILAILLIFHYLSILRIKSLRQWFGLF
jgi:hypothetical protein